MTQRESRDRNDMRAASSDLLTADDLATLPDDEFSYELVDGRLERMTKRKAAHGVCAGRLFRELDRFVESCRLGVVVPQDSGFQLASDPDTVRAPDVAFVSRGRVPEEGIPVDRFWEGAPDLAVEVVSPGDRRVRVAARVDTWLDRGSRAVWVVWPRERRVSVHARGVPPIELTETDVLEGGDLLAGFTCRLDRLFEGLARR